ncbi:MAG: SCO6880 family protein [Acidimicrobiales bacterium]
MAEPATPARVDRLHYRFPPLEKRGVIAGWRGGQIAVVALSLLVAVLAVRSRPSIGGIALALLGVGLGLTVAFWPIRGRTGEQWLPLVARWLWGGPGGDRRQLAPGPRLGHRVTVGAEADPATGPKPAVDVHNGSAERRPGMRRGVFGGLTLTGVPFGADQSGREMSGPAMAMLLDAPARTATAVLAVCGHSFALLGPGDQDSRVAAWARVLSALAREGSEVHRVQWVESCVPDDGGAVRRYRDTRAVVRSDSPAGRSYGSLIAEGAPSTRRHRMLVALSLHTSRSSRVIRAAGGGTTGAGRVLAREVLSLHRALDGADVEVEGVLGPGALARLIGGAVAPSAGPFGPVPAGPGAPGSTRTRPGSTAPFPGTGPDPAPHWPWPMALEPRWDAVRTDGTWHATYWIAEWPRVDVTPDFLGPLFFSPFRRSIVVTMEPVSPSRAARQVAQSRTADLADGELRRRGGFLVTARHTREKQSVEDRDVELADGHAQYRFSGYVTVTADTYEELVDTRAAVEQAAGQSRIELRLLYGEQDVAFACSLPLGRGLS